VEAEDEDPLERALGYPYHRPEGSFVYEPATGAEAPLRREQLGGRTVVLAIGSNAAPVQLRRKFGRLAGPGDVIPVVAGTLADHDVVFGALVASYGSIPATLHPSPGTGCRIHATLLTPAQLAVMNRSEGLGVSYDLVEISPDLVELEAPAAGQIWGYVARAGALRVDSSPIALAAIPATGRRFPASSQHEVLRRVADLVGAGTAAEFVHRVVADPGFRDGVNRALRVHAAG
jgi:hypothetical protein